MTDRKPKHRMWRVLMEELSTELSVFTDALTERFGPPDIIRHPGAMRWTAPSWHPNFPKADRWVGVEYDMLVWRTDDIQVHCVRLYKFNDNVRMFVPWTTPSYFGMVEHPSFKELLEGIPSKELG